MNQLGPECAGRHADGVSQGPSHSGRGAGLLISPQPQGPDLEMGQQPDHSSCFKRPEVGQKPGSETPRTARLVLTWRINYHPAWQGSSCSAKAHVHPCTTATPRPRASEVAQARDPGAGQGGREAICRPRFCSREAERLPETMKPHQTHTAQGPTALSRTDWKPQSFPPGPRAQTLP